MRRDFYTVWLGTVFMAIGLGVLLLLLWMALPLVQNPGSYFQGQMNAVTPSGNTALDFIRPLSLVLLTIGIYLVLALVGGQIMKAGWSVLRPQPELINVRLRPRSVAQALEAEQPPAASAASVQQTR